MSELYDTEDPLTKTLQSLGFQTKPDYWLDTDLILGMEVNLNGIIIRYHWEAPQLMIQHYELPSQEISLQNPFRGLFQLVQIIHQAELPITFLKGKPLLLSNGRLPLERLHRFYKKMGAVLLEDEPGWIRFDLSKWPYNRLATPNDLWHLNK